MNMFSALSRRLFGFRWQNIQSRMTSSMNDGYMDTNSLNEPPSDGDIENIGNQDKKYRNYDVNRVSLIGRVANTPLFKEDGYEWAIMSVITRTRRNAVDVHSVTATGNMANIVHKLIKKGDKVFLSGNLRFNGEKYSVKLDELTLIARSRVQRNIEMKENSIED